MQTLSYGGVVGVWLLSMNEASQYWAEGVENVFDRNGLWIAVAVAIVDELINKGGSKNI